MKFITTKSSGGDQSFRTGKEIRFYSDSKNYRITSYTVEESERLIREIYKRLDSSLKVKMKNEYLDSEKSFWKSENDYRRWMFRIVLPICVIILILLWFLK